MSLPAELSGSTGQPKRKPRYQPMLLAVIPFAVGIFTDRWLDLPSIFWLTTCVTLLFGWMLAYWHQQAGDVTSGSSSTTQIFWLSSLMLISAFAAAGGLWHHARWNWQADNHIICFTHADPQLCCLRGQLVTEPRVAIRGNADDRLNPLQKPVRTTLRLETTAIRDGRTWMPVSGQTDVVLHAIHDDLRSGDELQIFGKLFGLKPPTNPGQFDFENYMRSQTRFATVHVYQPAAIEVLARPQRWSGATAISRIRRQLNDVAWRLIDDDEAAFASAILLGNREQLSVARRAAFLETGTAHLLAISGLHVGILAASIFGLFRLGLLSRKKCLIATILFVLGYMWLVEFRPTVVRAAILISLYCVGRLAGQRGYSFNLLAVSAWIVLLINPMDLFGLGPQLSFLAVATLAFAKDWIWWPQTDDPIERLIADSRPTWQRRLNGMGRAFRTTALASAMIWLCALPLVAWYFHLVAPVGLLLNPLLMIPIALGLYAGAATLLLGNICEWPAMVCGQLCEFTLGGIEWSIQLAQGLPMSHFWATGPPLISLVLFYILLFLCVAHPTTRLPGRWVACIGLIWLVFGWLLPNQASYTSRNQSRSMICTFVDVGHGTSVLTQFPDGRNLLYDCGSFSSSRYGLQNISGVLWSEGIIHLDAVVLSHADVDHFNALPGLCERFSIGVVYLSPQMLASPSDSVACVKEALAAHQIPVQVITSNFATSDTEPLSVEVLSPVGDVIGSSDNADSVVVRISCGGRSILLPGDLEAEGLEQLLNSPPIASDVLMLAHHGSPNSNPRALIDWCQPKIVVASCGRGRLKPGICQQVESMPCQFLHTDQDGAVRLTLTAKQIDAQIFPAGSWQQVER